jgi:riboflavin synthase alpha subunit
VSTREFIEKAIVGLIGLSLSINAFLIKAQLSDMYEGVKLLTHSIAQLQIDHAVLSKDVQLHRDWLQSYQGRLQYVEARVERFNTLLERK